MIGKTTKLALQLAGLTAWATFWIGGSMFLLKRSCDKEEAQLKKERDEREAKRRAANTREP